MTSVRFGNMSIQQILFILPTQSSNSPSSPFPSVPHPLPSSPTTTTTTVRDLFYSSSTLLTTKHPTETMVSYKSVFKAIFRSEHADDSVLVPSSSRPRPTPTRAFTVPASPARPRTLTKQPPAAGPSNPKHLSPYANNSNRHSAIALRDIISPRPRLRKNSLPSEFPDQSSTLSPRATATPIPTAVDAHSQEQRQLSASPVQHFCQSHNAHLREPHSSLEIYRSDSPNEESELSDHLDDCVDGSRVRESSDINLLLSPEPEDARKAMSKRLEGLAMALDMFQPIQTITTPAPPRHPGFTSRGLPRLDTSLNVTHPLITFPISSKSPAVLGSTSLSPIENWRDDEGDEQSSEDDEIQGDDDEELSYFHIPGSKFSGSSHSSSSVSSSTSDLPPTPVDPPVHSPDAVQLLPPFLPASPVAFNLGPVVQSRVENCKATPTPVVSVDARDAQSGIVLL